MMMKLDESVAAREWMAFTPDLCFYSYETFLSYFVK